MMLAASNMMVKQYGTYLHSRKTLDSRNDWNNHRNTHESVVKKKPLCSHLTAISLQSLGTPWVKPPWFESKNLLWIVPPNSRAMVGHKLTVSVIFDIQAFNSLEIADPSSSQWIPHLTFFLSNPVRNPLWILEMFRRRWVPLGAWHPHFLSPALRNMPRACRDIGDILGSLQVGIPCGRGLIGPEPCFFAIFVAAAWEESHIFWWNEQFRLILCHGENEISMVLGKIWEIYGFTMVIMGFCWTCRCVHFGHLISRETPQVSALEWDPA